MSFHFTGERGDDTLPFALAQVLTRRVETLKELSKLVKREVESMTEREGGEKREDGEEEGEMKREAEEEADSRVKIGVSRSA